MAEFVTLWDLVQNVHFSDQEDKIKWKWTADGSYTSRSTYIARLNGTYSTFDGEAVWQAHAEGKHKFFAWLLCSFAKEVWLLVSNWTGGQIKMLEDDLVDVEEWWKRSLSPFNKKQRRSVVAYLISQHGTYGRSETGDFCHDPNRRVFEGRSLQPHQVFAMIQEDINWRKRACGNLDLG
ncbi:hypothetical protein SETIT_7G297800v2 [Setaria italica]|uniref:Reverse transcriptase zinc-binding domain-containing protein n=1 Tax=Setaria italica TaxID=4555 RepID=A0A368S178_SETIT|nr:hypothetical protein SETIT_7G297800v2 [Setaria italica]